jgi:exopolysaccharide biosynthesis polyprenyl glycosylphosphotransferase
LLNAAQITRGALKIVGVRLRVACHAFTIGECDRAPAAARRTRAEARAVMTPGPTSVTEPRPPPLASGTAAYTRYVRQRRVRRQIFVALTVCTDALVILAAFALAYWLRYQFTWPQPLAQIVRDVPTEYFVPFRAFLPYALLLTALLLVLFAIKGLYRLPRSAGILQYAAIIASSTITGVAALIVAVFIYRQTEFYSRLIFAFAWVTIVVFLLLTRVAVVEIRRLLWVRGIARERVLVVGGSGLGRGVMDRVVAQPFLGYTLVGYLDDRPAPSHERADGHYRRLGVVDDLERVVTSRQIDQVMLALPFWEQQRLPELVNHCRTVQVEFRVVPDLYQLSFDKLDMDELNGIPLIGMKELTLTGWNLVVKRALDLTLVLLSLPLVLLVTLAFAAAIRWDSPGPVIFRQRRIGKGGRPFTAYKFRSMHIDAEARKAELAAENEADGPLFKMRNDPRVTRVGRWIRKTSLDELPQLWNVVRGEMSLVGPRPPTPDEVAQYEPWHLQRLDVTPGLTGLWQVLGRSDTSFDEMVRLDIFYAENWSPGLDLRIILQTVPVVLSGKGAY